MTLLQIICIAVVEGVTEFLPVSSTDLMIIAQKLLGGVVTGVVCPDSRIRACSPIVKIA